MLLPALARDSPEPNVGVARVSKGMATAAAMVMKPSAYAKPIDGVLDVAVGSAHSSKVIVVTNMDESTKILGENHDGVAISMDASLLGEKVVGSVGHIQSALCTVGVTTRDFKPRITTY